MTWLEHYKKESITVIDILFLFMYGICEDVCVLCLLVSKCVLLVEVPYSMYVHYADMYGACKHKICV